MSFLGSLLAKFSAGGSSGEPKVPATPAKSVEHKGFAVSATPFEHEGRYQTSGTIEKEIDGVRRQHRFIRADSHPSADQAVEFSIQKGCQIVDQMGGRVFA